MTPLFGSQQAADDFGTTQQAAFNKAASSYYFTAAAYSSLVQSGAPGVFQEGPQSLYTSNVPGTTFVGSAQLDQRLTAGTADFFSSALNPSGGGTLSDAQVQNAISSSGVFVPSLSGCCNAMPSQIFLVFLPPNIQVRLLPFITPWHAASTCACGLAASCRKTSAVGRCSLHHCHACGLSC